MGRQTALEIVVQVTAPSHAVKHGDCQQSMLHQNLADDRGHIRLLPIRNLCLSHVRGDQVVPRFRAQADCLCVQQAVDLAMSSQPGALCT